MVGNVYIERANPKRMPNLYILAGPNGAGKTTTAFTLLPMVLHVRNFVNADEIARGLSPFDVDAVAFEAGRIMLQRIDYLLGKGEDFALETTLATRSYVQLIRRAKQKGYAVNLFYVYLSSPEMAVERVAQRVRSGGHSIPDDVIFRRYSRSLTNLFQLYLPICDFFMFVDNSGDQPVQIAQGGVAYPLVVSNYTLWGKLTGNYGN